MGTYPSVKVVLPGYLHKLIQLVMTAWSTCCIDQRSLTGDPADLVLQILCTLLAIREKQVTCHAEPTVEGASTGNLEYIGVWKYRVC